MDNVAETIVVGIMVLVVLVLTMPIASSIFHQNSMIHPHKDRQLSAVMALSVAHEKICKNREISHER